MGKKQITFRKQLLEKICHFFKIRTLNKKCLLISTMLFIFLLLINTYYNSSTITLLGVYDAKGSHIHTIQLPFNQLKLIFGNLDIVNNHLNIKIDTGQENLQNLYFKSLCTYTVFHINTLYLVLSFIIWPVIYLLLKQGIFKYLFLYTPFILLGIIHYKALFDIVSEKYSDNTSWSQICDFYAANSLIVIILAMLLSFFFLWKKLRVPTIIFTIILTLILSIDYIVIDNLDARFIFSEIITQGKEFDTAWEMLKKYATTELSLWNALFIINLIFIFIHFRNTSLKIVLSFWGIICLAFISMHITWDKGIFNYLYYNVFDVNFKNHQSVKHSQKAIQKLQSVVDVSQECIPGLDTHKNVILIIAESLSSYKIKTFNGLENKMPKLDIIAGQGLSFKNFYGNSHNTLGGIFAILTGQTMIQDYFSLGNFNYTPYYNETLPKRLAKHGYFSKFFTGIDLAHGMDTLLQDSGFTELSISSDPFYKGKERIIFNSVPDNILFDNVITHLTAEKKYRPFLYVISTISTHGPYIDPVTKERSFDKTLTFLDNELDRFINNLRKTDFFKNGILIITSDHRVMLPVSNNEYQRYGLMADSAIPLIILGDNPKFKRIENRDLYSQTDLVPSLEYYLTNKGCFNKFQRNLFDNNYHNDVCMIHSYRSPKDKIGIYCSKEKHADIYLNGDDTTISDETLSTYKNYVLYMRTRPLLMNRDKK